MDKTNNIENRLKSFLALNGTNLSKIVKVMNANLNTTYTAQNINQKLKSGTINFVEVENIINTLGFKFDLF